MSNERMDEQMKNLKTQNGITLIALVITIIVLLILAGVAVGAALNGESILYQFFKKSFNEN